MSFVKATMLHMGFSHTWTNRVMTLYTNAFAAVNLNDEAGETFEIERSVCQRCPLAFYLYLLVAHVLGYMLDDPRRGVIGLRLPDNSRTSNLMFANDTNLLLEGTQENLNTTMEVLTMFCEASGAKLNENKSVAIWAGRQPRDWIWVNDHGIVWLSEEKSTRYQEYPIGFHMNSANRDRKVIMMVTKQLATWSPRNLSMAGRHLIVNQVLLASIWYLCIVRW